MEATRRQRAVQVTSLSLRITAGLGGCWMAAGSACGPGAAGGQGSASLSRGPSSQLSVGPSPPPPVSLELESWNLGIRSQRQSETFSKPMAHLPLFLTSKHLTSLHHTLPETHTWLKLPEPSQISPDAGDRTPSVPGVLGSADLPPSALGALSCSASAVNSSFSTS